MSDVYIFWDQAESLRQAGVTLECRLGLPHCTPWMLVEGPLCDYHSDLEFRVKPATP